MKIKSIKRENFNGEVYNFSVKDTHTYIAEGVVVHNCNYCYTSATKLGSNFENIIEKAHGAWGCLQPEERPFQIAIGGAGESTLHPDWIEFIKTTHALGIMPNYTTNSRNDVFCKTPFGNTYTIMMARALIQGEKVGKGPHTDMLCISFSSVDELAHQYGLNSVEMQDMIVKLDGDIAGFLSYLDAEYGAGNYLMFLTADHGGSHNQKFLTDLNVPAGVLSKTTVKDLNSMLKDKFGQDSLVIGFTNYYQVFLNNPLLAKGTVSRPAVRQAIIDWFLEKPEVMYAFDLYNINSANLPTKIKDMVLNGYNRRRGGDVQVILNPAWYEFKGKTKGNTHGTWSPADTHIPLIFYGWNIKKGETTVECYTTDIAPTISALLRIQMPNGCIGKPIQLK